MKNGDRTFSLILGLETRKHSGPDLRGFCLSIISAYGYRQKNPLKYSISALHCRFYEKSGLGGAIL
jgi:hypothetical protein